MLSRKDANTAPDQRTIRKNLSYFKLHSINIIIFCTSYARSTRDSLTNHATKTHTILENSLSNTLTGLFGRKRNGVDWRD